MTTASVSEAKNQLSALLKLVQAGQSIIITDRGVPVARLEPVQLGPGVPPRMIALAQQGLVRLPKQQPDASWLDAPRIRVTEGLAPSEIVMEERREGR